MGLIWHVPGFPNYAYDTRHGDSQFFLDKRPNGDLHFFVIDGYDSDGDDRMIEDLKLFKAHSDKAEIWAQISHAHCFKKQPACVQIVYQITRPNAQGSSRYRRIDKISRIGCPDCCL
jgi:hypothetical protein